MTAFKKRRTDQSPASFDVASGFPSRPIGGIMGHGERPQKVTFADMRDMGVRGVLYCADYRCSHSITLRATPTPRPFVA